MADAVIPQDEPTPGDEPAPATRTTVSRRWLRRIQIMLVVLLAFGVWGLADAIVFYPRRGAGAAEYFEFQHLSILQNVGNLSNQSATITDPAATLERLAQKLSQTGAMESSERATYDWLTQLKHVGRLDPRNTAFPRTDFRARDGTALQIDSADARFRELRDRFTIAGATAPSPLASYDIPSQWLIAVTGLLGGLYLIALIARVRAKVYRWDPADKRLTLPDGASIVPADVVEFDRRKWEKLFIALHIRKDHPQIAGGTLNLDLLRYSHLETWVLEMERSAPPPAPAARAP